MKYYWYRYHSRIFLQPVAGGVQGQSGENSKQGTDYSSILEYHSTASPIGVVIGIYSTSTRGARPLAS